MSAVGPSRHFAWAQQSGRFWREADINWKARPACSVANNPKQSCAMLRICDAAFAPAVSGHSRDVLACISSSSSCDEDRMKRREFIGLACGASVLAATISRAAWAVEPHKVYRIAMLHPSHPVSDLTENGRLNYYREFFHELRRLGYIEGKNLVVERFSGEGRIDHYPELAREAVARNPDVIFAVNLMVGPLHDPDCRVCLRSGPVRPCDEYGAAGRKHHRC
jgi:hypothetical protein